jgi:hypothetical protein
MLRSAKENGAEVNLDMQSQNMLERDASVRRPTTIVLPRGAFHKLALIVVNGSAALTAASNSEDRNTLGSRFGI